MGTPPFPADTQTDVPSTTGNSLTAWLPHLLVVVVALVGTIVLCALHDLTGEVTAGIIGAAIGGGVAVAGVNAKGG